MGFPFAAGKQVLWSVSMDSLNEGKICCKSYIFKLNKNHAIDKINWISLMRLYKFTCKEAGFELSPAQPCHHPSVKKI